jgi:hypothetical protein
MNTMASESLFFRGTFLMKFLADELERAHNEIVNEMTDTKDERDALYLKYCIEPIVLREDELKKELTVGQRIVDPMYLVKPISDDADRMDCRVMEYRIPFEGDERLFRFTTRPLPYYPFGRLDDGVFVISVKEGEELYLSDYEYNLTLLRDCVEIIAGAVSCYNSDLKMMIREIMLNR